MISTVNPFQQRSNQNPQGAVPVPFAATAQADFFAQGRRMNKAIKSAGHR